MKNQYQLPCNVAQTLNLIGDKWTLLILYAVMHGNSTYKELQQALPGIASNLLSERLKTLEEDGFIRSQLYQEHPPRYQYRLTSAGEDLHMVFHSIMLWGEKHLSTCYKRLIHTSCGHPVQMKYYCEECGREVSEQELEVTEA